MMNATAWQPGASLSNLRLRARLLAEVRSFFARRQVLEVETPLLCHATGTDPHLESIDLMLGSRAGQPADRRFLQTSPEFAMKRLLAAGSGPIYQLCKAFRRDESGRRHNPEFTMLEWYRPGFDDRQLMDEVEALLALVLPTQAASETVSRVSYRQLFLHYLAVDPHASSTSELEALSRQHIDLGNYRGDRDDWLNVLFSHLIEPQLQGVVFLYDYPASQAALAQIRADEDGVPVARRFELFVNGMELANGYLELTNAAEQARRFAQDNRRRADLGLPVYPVDNRLLAALEHGIPSCAGVALGFDRLVMLAAGVDSIAEVISFMADNA